MIKQFSAVLIEMRAGVPPGFGEERDALLCFFDHRGGGYFTPCKQTEGIKNFPILKMARVPEDFQEMIPLYHLRVCVSACGFRVDSVEDRKFQHPFVKVLADRILPFFF